MQHCIEYQLLITYKITDILIYRFCLINDIVVLRKAYNYHLPSSFYMGATKISKNIHYRSRESYTGLGNTEVYLIASPEKRIFSRVPGKRIQIEHWNSFSDEYSTMIFIILQNYKLKINKPHDNYNQSTQP